MRWSVASAGFLAALAAAPRALADVKSECIDASEEAQGLRDEGRFRLAREKLLICAREACPDPVEQECLAWLAGLDRDSPSLIFAARDKSGHDTSAVQVFIDGLLVAQALDGRPLPVDPGEHVVRLVIADAPPIEQKIVVRVGERNRLLSADFAHKTAPPPAASPARGPAAQPSQSIALPLLVGGVGLASLGAFGYFGWTGKSEIDDMKASCGKTQSCDQSKVDAADRKLLAGDVFLGVGVVSVVVATVLLLSGTRSESTSSTAAVGVSPTPGGFVTSFSRIF